VPRPAPTIRAIVQEPDEPEEGQQVSREWVTATRLLFRLAARKEQLAQATTTESSATESQTE
jgi:hypothetical protein